MAYSSGKRQNSFPNREITEKVYIEQPIDYKVNKTDQPTLSCRLNKALYGFKQSARVWYIKARSRLEELGFTAFPDDESCFIHQHMQLVISLYVDDIQYMGAILDKILKVES